MSLFALHWIAWVFFYSVARDASVEHIDVIVVIYGIYMNQRFLFVGWRQQSCDCTLVDFNRFGKRCSAAELSKTLPVVVQFTIMSRVFKAVYWCYSIVQTVMFLLAKNHNFITSGVLLIHNVLICTCPFSERRVKLFNSQALSSATPTSVTRLTNGMLSHRT